MSLPPQMQTLGAALDAWCDALSQFHVTLTDDAPADLHLLEILRETVSDARGWAEEARAHAADWPAGLPVAHRLIDLAAGRMEETLTPERLGEILALSRRSPVWRQWLSAARAGLAALTENHHTARTRLREAWSALLCPGTQPDTQNLLLNSNRCSSYASH